MSIANVNYKLKLPDDRRCFQDVDLPLLAMARRKGSSTARVPTLALTQAYLNFAMICHLPPDEARNEGQK
jgi:hypothetical protein